MKHLAVAALALISAPVGAVTFDLGPYGTKGLVLPYAPVELDFSHQVVGAGVPSGTFDVRYWYTIYVNGCSPVDDSPECSDYYPVSAIGIGDFDSTISLQWGFVQAGTWDSGSDGSVVFTNHSGATIRISLDSDGATSLPLPEPASWA